MREHGEEGAIFASGGWSSETRAIECFRFRSRDVYSAINRKRNSSLANVRKDPRNILSCDGYIYIHGNSQYIDR